MGIAFLGMSGCSLFRATLNGYDTGPDGISRAQQELREALVHGDFAVALGAREDDQLLRALSLGSSSYYASQYARSASLLDSAALLADDRITNSVSANALALVSSDLARPYQARRTERLFIPYYAMLAFARLDQWEDAAVEARRLGGLLAEYAADRVESERAMHATLHYLAGVMFERAGEKGDAQVAYRLARALLPEQVDSSRSQGSRGDGEILVVLERGFVAHRATEMINVRLGGEDYDAPGTRPRERTVYEKAKAAARIAAGGNADLARLAAKADRRRDRDDDRDDDDGYLLRVALPSIRRAPRMGGEPSMVVDGEGIPGARVGSVLDDAVGADQERERAGLMARATARAMAKYAVTKAVKDKKGEVAGSLANVGASLMERADVRSWHLLPQMVTLLRVRVPEGQRQLQLEVGEGRQRVDLGEVRVRAGQLTIVSTRVWRDIRNAPLLATAR